MFLVLSPDSKMVRNIKIGWKLTKLWKNCELVQKKHQMLVFFLRYSVFSYSFFKLRNKSHGFFCRVCCIPFRTFMVSDFYDFGLLWFRTVMISDFCDFRLLWFWTFVILDQISELKLRLCWTNGSQPFGVCILPNIKSCI